MTCRPRAKDCHRRALALQISALLLVGDIKCFVYQDLIKRDFEFTQFNKLRAVLIMKVEFLSVWVWKTM